MPCREHPVERDTPALVADHLKPIAGPFIAGAGFFGFQFRQGAFGRGAKRLETGRFRFASDR